jgi:hypothetical protein
MAKAPSAAASAGALKIEQAAGLLRLSVRRINQLIQEGWIKRDSAGTLTIVAAVHGYLDFKDEEIKRIQLKASYNEVRRARAHEISLRTAKQERELIPREEAEEFVQLLIGEVVSRLLGLPARYTRDVNDRKQLETLVASVRAEVADIAAKYGEAFRTGGELTATAEEDGAG